MRRGGARARVDPVVEKRAYDVDVDGRESTRGIVVRRFMGAWVRRWEYVSRIQTAATDPPPTVWIGHVMRYDGDE